MMVCLILTHNIIRIYHKSCWRQLSYCGLHVRAVSVFGKKSDAVCGFLAYFYAVLRFSDPPYAPLRAASNFIALISPSRSVHELLVKFTEFVWIWILKDYIEVQEKKNVTVLRCPSSTKREIWYFHVLFGQRWQRNVRKSMLHVRSSVWFCLSKLIAYFTSTTVTAVL